MVNWTLTSIALCVIVASSLGVAVFIICDYLKRKKEKKELEEEQANIEEAFSNPENKQNKNIYGVLWGSKSNSNSEKTPLMSVKTAREEEDSKRNSKRDDSTE